MLIEFALLAFQVVTQHTVTLNWIDSNNPTGVTYTIHRATGMCSGTPTYSTLATAIVPKTYVDNTVIPGNYCYMVTANLNGMESAPSNTAAAPVPPFIIGSLTASVQ